MEIIDSEEPPSPLKPVDRGGTLDRDINLTRKPVYAVYVEMSGELLRCTETSPSTIIWIEIYFKKHSP